MRKICRFILWCIMIPYTLISFTCMVFLTPIFVIVTFAERDPNWSDFWRFWKEGAFVGFYLMQECETKV